MEFTLFGLVFSFRIPHLFIRDLKSEYQWYISVCRDFVMPKKQDVDVLLLMDRYVYYNLIFYLQNILYQVKENLNEKGKQ